MVIAAAVCLTFVVFVAGARAATRKSTRQASAAKKKGNAAATTGAASGGHFPSASAAYSASDFSGSDAASATMDGIAVGKTAAGALRTGAGFGSLPESKGLPPRPLPDGFYSTVLTYS